MANPDPSPSTRFGAGESGNPIGKTSEQRKAELEAAEVAAKVQKQMLDALSAHIDADPDAALGAIKADPLKLIKDAMDRAHGTPKASTEISGPDGGSIPMSLNVTFE